MDITKTADEKAVFVLLMEYKTRIPRFYQHITAKKYTHAAIGLKNRWFFRFFIKGGFRAEKPWLFTK